MARRQGRLDDRARLGADDQRPAGAVGEAKQALRLGLKPVGVLDSADFSSLHPGYYVVFFGIYGNEAEAQSHVIEAHRRGYREPYPRRITR